MGASWKKQSKMKLGGFHLIYHAKNAANINNQAMGMKIEVEGGKVNVMHLKSMSKNEDKEYVEEPFN